MGGESCGCGNGRCGARRRGTASGVIAKALMLLLLGVGVGAAHSVMQPVKLRMADTEATTIQIPGPGPTRNPVANGENAASNSGGADAASESPIGDPGQAATTEPDSDPEFVVPIFTTMELNDKYLTLDQTRILWEAGVAQFMDARHLEEFAAGHIPRTVLWDPRDMYASRLPEGFEYLDQQMVTVIYCGGGDCDASENLGKTLQEMGFVQVRIFREGFPAWEAAGLPVNVGEPAASSPRPSRTPGGGL